MPIPGRGQSPAGCPDGCLLWAGKAGQYAGHEAGFLLWLFLALFCWAVISLPTSTASCLLCLVRGWFLVTCKAELSHVNLASTGSLCAPRLTKPLSPPEVTYHGKLPSSRVEASRSLSPSPVGLHNSFCCSDTHFSPAFWTRVLHEPPLSSELNFVQVPWDTFCVVAFYARLGGATGPVEQCVLASLHGNAPKKEGMNGSPAR